MKKNHLYPPAAIGTVLTQVRQIESTLESGLSSRRAQLVDPRSGQLKTEAMTLLEAELKDEGAKAVVAYKASRGFESGLEKMGWVSYEFGVADLGPPKDYVSRIDKSGSDPLVVKSGDRPLARFGSAFLEHVEIFPKACFRCFGGEVLYPFPLVLPVLV
ncbi:hypothetical protein GW17_00035081 [Ensete ventricosum]|nr:hypothetical protein GW17_00035081 [Ensete ventricosum]